MTQTFKDLEEVGGGGGFYQSRREIGSGPPEYASNILYFGHERLGRTLRHETSAAETRTLAWLLNEGSQLSVLYTVKRSRYVLHEERSQRFSVRLQGSSSSSSNDNDSGYRTRLITTQTY